MLLNYAKKIAGTLCLFCLPLIVMAGDNNEQTIALTENSSITINAGQTKEPISKYIYGQFIEHLGRCIYGGIWAEMLEDRKFYFPVTKEFKPWSIATDRGNWKGGDFPVLSGSPWKVIGDSTVQMLKEDVYVGEHTPEIRLSGKAAPGGIEQGELAFVKGKEYEGYVIIAGNPSAAPIHVNLILGESGSVKEALTLQSVTEEYTKYSFTFKADKSVQKGRLQITGGGKGAFKIGTVSLMPADNVNGYSPSTLQLMKELNSPVYRWPGGNFVSDYDWKDGVGERDKRPPRKNPAWTGIESNDVGIHEFMDLCRLLDTEPFIAVNTGLGSVEEAAEEVEYCNGSSNTAMGKWRAENGHPEPYKVKWWAVGNEMYGSWQLGHMPLEDYVKKHNNCAEVMRAIDPSIQLIAVGSVGEWSEAMMTYCADHMALISEHIYRKDKEDLVEHVEQIPNAIKRVADAHRKYRDTIQSLKGKDIRIAMDEWNYWYGQYIYGELGVQYHLQDALGIAAGLHEYFRNSDIFFMANYAQTVNVIGAIKTNKTDAQMETTGLALKLYRNHFGEIPVEISGVPKPLDAVAALSKDKRYLTVAVVNPTEDIVILDLNVKDIKLDGTGKQWQIKGSDKMAFNEPGKEMNVRIVENNITNGTDKIQSDPVSVTLFSFKIK